MKILQVCNKITFPPDEGGSVAVLNISLPLSDAGHEITIFSFITEKHGMDENDKAILEKKVKLRLVKQETGIKMHNLLGNLLFSDKPYSAQRFDSPLFHNELKKILSEQHFDVVQLEGLYLLPYIMTIREFSSALIVFRSHNAEHEIWSSYSINAGNPLKRLYLANLAARLRKMAEKYINSYDLLVPISDPDSSFYQSIGNNKPVLVCSSGYDASNIFPGDIRPDGSLFYIGSLDWLPNQQGLLWFIGKVFKELVKTSPSLVFHIAGRNAPEEFIRKIKHPNIRFCGEVRDARDFVRSKGISIVPLFSGSGMRVKIIESMANGKPVVATSKAAEGLDVVNGENILVADRPDDFRHYVNKLLNDNVLYKKLATGARELVLSKYDNNKISASLIEFYNKHLQ